MCCEQRLAAESLNTVGILEETGVIQDLVVLTTSACAPQS